MNTDYMLSKISENRCAVFVLSNFFNHIGVPELRNANLVCFPPDSSLFGFFCLTCTGKCVAGRIPSQLLFIPPPWSTWTTRHKAGQHPCWQPFLPPSRLTGMAKREAGLHLFYTRNDNGLWAWNWGTACSIRFCLLLRPMLLYCLVSCMVLMSRPLNQCSTCISKVVALLKLGSVERRHSSAITQKHNFYNRNCNFLH